MSAGRRDGFALVIVLLVLLLLLVLATPFLLSARNADRASVQVADRAEGRVALDAAARRARLALGASHPSIDRTPYFDSLAELETDPQPDPSFLDPRDPRGAMWDVELDDLAGRIDLASAPPQVIANLAGASSRFSQPIDPDSKELALSSTSGFEPQGYAWVLGETIRYESLEAGQLVRFTRGLFGPAEPQDWKGGPRPASQHAAGAPVIDQRALALPAWRVATEDGELRAPDAVEDLPGTAAYALSIAAGAPDAMRRYLEDYVAPLAREGSVHAGVRAGPVWQHATRLVSEVVGGEDGRISVVDARWFNAGATVRVRGRGASELALVQQVEPGPGARLVLDRVLANDYEPYSAIVEVLARRPVNLNTATPEVLRALFLNLQVEGRNSRVTKDEAAALVEAVVAARPFDGFEDFVERLVLPAAGIAPPKEGSAQRDEGFLDEWDALALYVNGLNANDRRLAYATRPFAFTTRDVYAFELRASVNAPSMAERAAFVREQAEVVVPQRELLALWARQEDFDESARLADAMPWWIAGPRATARFDALAPASRRWASLGALEARVDAASGGDPAALAAVEQQSEGEWVFPSREETAWIQLKPARVAETETTEGRVLHFDHETRDLEGRYLPDEPVARAANDPLVAWTGSTGLAKPLALSLWFRPRATVDALLLDVRGTSVESDRVTLGFDSASQDLVLRVLDAPGDHPASAQVEVAEARYSMSQGGASPGLPLDVWHHVELDVRGTRPDQVHMLVNGLAHGVRIPGMSRLTAAVGEQDVALALESVEGFPERGCVQVGAELVEYRLDAANKALIATHESTGEFAGHGGRVAREVFAHPANGEGSALTTGLGAHPAGTTVRLYGYSATLRSNVGTGGAQLTRPLRGFRIAIAKGIVVSGSNQSGEQIALTGVPLGWSQLGTGIEGVNSGATAIDLGAYVAGVADSAVAESFPSTGGYVLLVQRRVDGVGDFANVVTTNGSKVGGAEIVWYSERQGTRLLIGRRGDATGLQVPGPDFSERRAFVVDFGSGYDELDARLEWKPFVIPISLGVTGAGALTAFPTPSAGFSEFAQITNLDDASKTEWMRYDEIREDHLVRCAPDALRAAYTAAVRLTWDDGAPVDPPAVPPGGGGGGSALFALAAPPAPAAAAQERDPSLWRDELGEADPLEDPVTRAVRTRIQFRGVFGTNTAQHTLSDMVLPTFRVEEAPGKAPGAHPDGGVPGALDHAFLLDATPTSLGTPVVVHHAYQPYDYVEASWQPDPADPLVAREGESVTQRIEDVNPDTDWKVDLDAVYVGLREACPVPYVPGGTGPATGAGGTAPPSDARLRARLVLHPSGELPREVTDVAIGGGAKGAPGAVPSATADEIVFGDARFTSAAGVAASSVEETLGASLVLLESIDDATLDATLSPREVRIARGRYAGATNAFVAELAQRGPGLLKIGEEIVAFAAVDPDSGDVTFAQGGRGLLGTTAQPHDPGEPVLWLEHRAVATIAGAPGPQDAKLTVDRMQGLPSSGTLLVGRELVHYTRIHGGSIEMPRASSVPGADDELGEGLFRGRFGTAPDSHPAGSAAVLFPFRYWDRWATRADAPELGFCGGSIDQPDAYWSSFFFSEEEVEGCELGVLVRLDPRVPWDADPEKEPRLRELGSGDENGAPIPLGAQSDQLSWRVFARYAPGAFAADTGLSHAWRRTPRLSRVGAFYFGPGVVLRSVER